MLFATKFSRMLFASLSRTVLLLSRTVLLLIRVIYILLFPGVLAIGTAVA